MNYTICEREEDMLAAVQSGTWNDELREHAGRCLSCADTIAVTEFLQREAELLRHDAQLPSAGLVWWRAQLTARQRALSQTTRPVDLAWNFALPAAVIAVLWRLIRVPQTQPSLNAWLSNPMHWSSTWAGPLGETALLVGGTTLICLLFGAFYLAWIET